MADQPWGHHCRNLRADHGLCGGWRKNAGSNPVSERQQFQLEDGSWWTGYVFPDDAFWPDEKPTWTAGAVLLAADALFDLTPASALFKTVEPAEASKTP